MKLLLDTGTAIDQHNFCQTIQLLWSVVEQWNYGQIVIIQSRKPFTYVRNCYRAIQLLSHNATAVNCRRTCTLQLLADTKTAVANAKLLSDSEPVSESVAVA